MPGKISLKLVDIIIPTAIASIFTLLITSWQLYVQKENQDRDSLISNAEGTAEETSNLLMDGYLHIYKLIDTVSASESSADIKSAITSFNVFKHKWRQDLIIEHFKISRYFGEHMANQLININKISQEHDKNTHDKSPKKVFAFSVYDLVDSIERDAYIGLLTQKTISDIMNDKYNDSIITFIEDKNSTMKHAADLLEQLDQSNLRYINALESVLNQIGEPRVMVLDDRKEKDN